jgi:hypothetical protein
MNKKLVLALVAVFVIGLAAFLVASPLLFTLPERSNEQAGRALPSEGEIQQARMDLEKQKKTTGSIAVSRSGCGKDAGSCCCAPSGKKCCCSDEGPTAAAPPSPPPPANLRAKGPITSGMSTIALAGSPMGQGPLVASSTLFARIMPPPQAQAQK